jgi:sigma-E factor negative regulatory protein RseA
MMKNIHGTPEETVEFDDVRASSISALMDGALSDTDVDAALAAAAQPDGQARWQLYHLIGDTLRAADLAAYHDPALLPGIRAALQQSTLTPPVLSPAATRRKAANDDVFRWKLASGFAAVAAVAAIGWNVWGVAHMPSGARQLAQTQPAAMQPLTPPVQVQVAARAAPEIGTAALPAQRLALRLGDDKSQMLRDSQLDQLLTAHRRMAAFDGDTSVFLRNATFEESER